MQLLLAGIGSCSSIDIILILKKQRQQLDDIQGELSRLNEKRIRCLPFFKVFM